MHLRHLKRPETLFCSSIRKKEKKERMNEWKKERLIKEKKTKINKKYFVKEWGKQTTLKY